MSQSFEGCISAYPNGDGDKGEFADAALQEGNLNFNGVLAFVRLGILHQQPARVLQTLGKFAIDMHVAERSLPLPPGHDGQRSAASGVIGAEDDVSGALGQPLKNCSRNAAGIHVPSVGNDAAHCGFQLMRLS